MTENIIDQSFTIGQSKEGIFDSFLLLKIWRG